MRASISEYDTKPDKYLKNAQSWILSNFWESRVDTFQGRLITILGCIKDSGKGKNVSSIARPKSSVPVNELVGNNERILTIIFSEK